MRLFVAIGLVSAAVGTTLSASQKGSTWNALPATVDGGSGGEAWFARHPSQDLIVFGRHEPNWQNHRLFMTRRIDGVWTTPTILPFSVDIDTNAPHFAPDGKSMLFASSRVSLTDPGEKGKRNSDIWRVSWDGKNWGTPQRLPAPINSPGSEIDALEVNNGVIYFTTMPPGENATKPDIFRATPTATGYSVEPVTAFNTAHTESTLFVTPDESLIVFHRAEDPRGLGKDDLFAALRTAAGWGPDIHLGAGANSPEYEYGPDVSPDRSTLYFTTHRDGEVKIMAVDLKAAMGE